MIRSFFKSFLIINWLLFLAVGFAGQAASADAPVKIIVLGDSLSAGFGLAPGEGFPAQLAAALESRGHAVNIVDAGVSGDTSSGGLARLEWSVPADADAVIVELGANDALRGINPDVTREAIEEIVVRLKARGQAVLLAGMQSPPNMGDHYADQFNPIFGQIAEKHEVDLYPFFLDGVAGNLDLNLPDGIHPTAEGIAIIVEKILPKVEKLIAATGES